MIQEESDSRMRAAAQDLTDRLGRLCTGRVITDRLVYEADQLIYDHSARCKQRGIDFPRMAVFLTPTISTFHIVRQDLDLPSIRTTMLNFVADHPDVTPMELAIAARRAWPHIQPGDLVDEAEYRKEVLEAKKTRAA